MLDSLTSEEKGDDPWMGLSAILLIVWLAGFVLFHAAGALISSPGTSLR